MGLTFNVLVDIDACIKQTQKTTYNQSDGLSKVNAFTFFDCFLTNTNINHKLKVYKSSKQSMT